MDSSLYFLGPRLFWRPDVDWKHSTSARNKNHETRYQMEKVAKVCSEIDYYRKSIYVQNKEKNPKNIEK